MPSTISGLASVVTSPASAKLETAAMTLRMILPDLVLGMSATIQTFPGRAILPISVSITLVTLSSISLLGLRPGLSETYASTARPPISPMTGTAAASATSATVSAADSVSLVPSRCPATLITWSTGRGAGSSHPPPAPRRHRRSKASRHSLLPGSLLYLR